jgi:hypothetical protein
VSPVTDITVFKGLGATSIFDFPATGLTGWTITATSGNTSFSTVTGAGGSAQIQNLDELVQWTICETLQNGWTQTFPTSNGGCYVRAPQTFLSGPDYVFGNKKNLNISTTLKDGLGNTIVVGGEAAPGALPTVHDTATVTGALQDIAPANSVSFTWFTNGTCNGDGTAAGTAALVGTLADGSTAQGPLSAGSYSFRATIAGDANYVGATSDCEPFTVTTVTIIKSSNGNPATFNFTLGSLSPSITTQAGTPNQGTTTVVVTSGAYTLSEAQQNGWVLVNISCPAPSGNASFTAAAGTNTTCSVENTATGATRTQGFWASHTDFSNNMWNTYVSPTYNNFCGTKTITATTGTNTNQLMGAFWASINSMSTGAKRSDIDQARMQLAQQLAAAMLNKYALGADDQGKVGVAMAAYCTSSTTSTAVNAIKNQVGVLSTWNASGDNVPLTFPYQHATPNRSKLQAYIAYWNTPK